MLKGPCLRGTFMKANWRMNALHPFLQRNPKRWWGWTMQSWYNTIIIHKFRKIRIKKKSKNTIRTWPACMASQKCYSLTSMSQTSAVTEFGWVFFTRQIGWMIWKWDHSYQNKWTLNTKQNKKNHIIINLLLPEDRLISQNKFWVKETGWTRRRGRL